MIHKRPSAYRTFQAILSTWITKLTWCTLKAIALHLMFFIIFTSIGNKVACGTKLALWKFTDCLVLVLTRTANCAFFYNGCEMHTWSTIKAFVEIGVKGGRGGVVE